MPKKRKKTLLWKIKSPDLEGYSYVFGTMHVQDKRVFSFLPALEELILECDAIANEFNLDELENAPSGHNQLLLPEGQTIRDILSPKRCKKLAAILKKEMNLDLKVVERNSPFTIINLLAQLSLKSEMPQSLDATLWQFAKMNDKTSLGLETLKNQMAIVHNMPMAYQLKNLNNSIKNFTKSQKDTDKVMKLYVEQDIFALYKATRRNLKEMRKILLFNRNELMAQRIAELSAKQNVFFAIGAAHLAGKNGVLRLIKKAGLKINPASLK